MFVTQIGVVTAQEPEADLGVTLSAGSGSAGVGVLVRYFNAGPSDATDTVITIDVPDGWWLAEGPAFCQEGTGAVTCVIGTYRAPAADFFQLRFMPSAPGEATIRATITSTTPDPNPANNQAEATVTVANEADLSVSLSRGTGTIGQGEVFNLFVQFQNSGPLPASDVTILVDLPEELQYAGRSCAETPSGDIECHFAEVDAMTAGVEIVDVRAASAGTFTIHASISSATPDPDPADNSDSLDVTVEPRADLSTVVTDLADPVKPGRAVTYVVEITNAGASEATDVRADVSWTTTAAGRIDVVGLNVTGASCEVTDERRVTCQATSLAAGSSIVVELQLRPRGPGEVSVTAGASAAEPDPDPSNNADTETTRIGAQQ
jgi:hypothetical protein